MCSEKAVDVDIQWVWSGHAVDFHIQWVWSGQAVGVCSVICGNRASKINRFHELSVECLIKIARIQHCSLILGRKKKHDIRSGSRSARLGRRGLLR